MGTVIGSPFPFFAEVVDQHCAKKGSEIIIPDPVEAQTGFEPVDTGVADHCLTTWLLRHIILYAFSTVLILHQASTEMTPTGIEPVLPP